MSGWPGQKVGTAPVAQPATAMPQGGGPTTRTIVALPNPQQDIENSRNTNKDALDAAKSAFRMMTPEEVKAAGLPTGGVYQVNGLGEIKQVAEAPKGGTPEKNAGDALRSVGVTLTDQQDRVADMILGSTSGGLQKFGADAYSFVTGDATDGMENIAKLKTISSDLTLAMTGGSLGNQVSNTDREFIVERMGNIADPNVPASARLAAWNEVKGRLARSLGVPADQVFFAGQGAPEQRKRDTDLIPGIRQPEMRGGLPAGTQVDIRANSIGEDGISRGQNYLESIGVFPNDQAKISAFWNANRGNPELTVENVTAWYRANGYDQALLDPATLQSYVEAAKAGNAEFGFDTSAVDNEYRDQLDAAIAEQGINPEDVGRSAVAGGSSGVTLGWNDEIMGALAAADEALKNGDIIGAYEANRDIRRRIRERSMEENPGVTLGAELGASLLVPVAGGRNAVARGGKAAVKAAAKTGAVIGGVAGAGYGEGTGGTLLGATTGAGLGYVVGGQGEKIVRKLRMNRINRARGGPPPSGGGGGGGEAIAAADRLNAATGSNIRMLPADVSGPGVRNVTGGAAKMTISGELIGRASQKLTDEAEKAKNALVGLVGGRAEPEIAGERALEGARKWMRTSATRRDALYARARAKGGNEPVDLVNARQVLDGHIAELSQTPGSAEGLARLQSLRAELDRPFPVEGVKRMRTRLRDDFGSDGLRSTDIERRVGQVIDAAEDDIVTSLQSAGKAEAARLYQRAAQSHRERVEVIDNVLAPIIGAKGDAPRSGEQIINAIEQAGRGNSARLAEFMKVLPDEDAGVIRGTIIDRLGRASAGQQDATGAAFSLNTFLTNWSKMSDRAKGTMFSGELRAALNDLAKVASARRDSGRYVNFSNTGSTIGNVASASAGVGALTNPAALGVFVIDGLTGALLSSPRFARWLAKMPSNPTAQRAHINGLSKIAAADSAIAADALGLQQQLLARFGAGDLPLAAEGQDKGGASTAKAGGTQ